MAWAPYSSAGREPQSVERADQPAAPVEFLFLFFYYFPFKEISSVPLMSGHTWVMGFENLRFKNANIEI